MQNFQQPKKPTGHLTGLKCFTEANKIDLSILDDNAKNCEREEGEPEHAPKPAALAALSDQDSLESASEDEEENLQEEKVDVDNNLVTGDVVGGVSGALKDPDTTKLVHWRTLWKHVPSDKCKSALDQRADHNNDNCSLPGTFAVLSVKFATPPGCSVLDGLIHESLNDGLNQTHESFICEHKSGTMTRSNDNRHTNHSCVAGPMIHGI